MCNYSLLIGNGINNITQGNSWLDVLNSLEEKYGIKINTKNKPFPLAYEEIYLNILNSNRNGFSEYEIKKAIADKIQKIHPNEIHERIVELECNNILTTNYDLTFELCLNNDINTENLKNKGKIKESRYNIFRHYEVEDKKIWHIHGALNNPNSIILGYEHYSGYLQSMRSYTTTGSQYKNESLKVPLIKRLKSNNINNSWLDDFFTKDIYIIGLNLDFVEIDLWWLLTFRERCRHIKKLDFQITNKITYYIPNCFYNNLSPNPKIELLKSVGVIINYEFGKRFEDKEKEYYLSVINDISSKNSN
ncbi:TPA: SIR2 family protein [Proteus mirabilis]|uniref:SIR2 family protein n=1 Tax=Proteus mirabilis TaxID=584 RepID=UPI00019D004C|nr:SIR2 family protein [Proteus mirabilis]EEI49527.1 hypothetical protein HMPREF0693_0537 [Proteus mirabilis ATCC 29906]MBI6495323.1 SIR2 family protein [Proteus mirabilis]QEQ99258.1 hypothetical protein EHZ20_04210 [Proteus mirabilis]HEJ9553634.1 SIR2 family protein [Proteus mirabilis]